MYAHRCDVPPLGRGEGRSRPAALLRGRPFPFPVGRGSLGGWIAPRDWWSLSRSARRASASPSLTFGFRLPPAPRIHEALQLLEVVGGALCSHHAEVVEVHGERRSRHGVRTR